MSTTIGFDDIAVDHELGYVTIASPYAGLSWSDFTAYSPAGHAPKHASGYKHGVVSGTQEAFTNSGATAHISLEGGSFDLKSAYMTSSFDKTNSVEVFGYRDGQQVYHLIVGIEKQEATLIKFNFEDVDDVSFRSVSGYQVAFDDLVVSHVDAGSGAALPDRAVTPVDNNLDLTAGLHMAGDHGFLAYQAIA